MIPFAGNKMQKLFLVRFIVASASQCGPRVTLYVLIWPTEQPKFENPDLNLNFTPTCENIYLLLWSTGSCIAGALTMLQR